MYFSADIISLQEVEMEQFYNFFLLELKRDGYEVSIFQKIFNDINGIDLGKIRHKNEPKYIILTVNY